jgi:hypothetical protein
MGKQRKTWTTEQKLTLILVALRDEHSVAALPASIGSAGSRFIAGKRRFSTAAAQTAQASPCPDDA